MGASCSMALLSQVSTSYPRVPRDSFARARACFLIIQLSGYGQFMLSTSFLPLHGCWSLHYDLCPSYFHTHSDRYAFSRFAGHLPVPANLLLSEMDIPFYTWPVCTENDNSLMFCQEVSSALLSARSGNDMLCSILFLSLVFNVLTDYFCWSACYWHFYKHW